MQNGPRRGAGDTDAHIVDQIWTASINIKEEFAEFEQFFKTEITLRQQIVKAYLVGQTFDFGHARINGLGEVGCEPDQIAQIDDLYRYWDLVLDSLRRERDRCCEPDEWNGIIVLISRRITQADTDVKGELLDRSYDEVTVVAHRR